MVACSAAEVAANLELEIAINQAQQLDPMHEGISFVRSPLDNFEIANPKGGFHLCLVHEPMREPLTIYQRRFEDHVTPLPLGKLDLRFLLQGLDYLHTRCRIVHTGEFDARFTRPLNVFSTNQQ